MSFYKGKVINLSKFWCMEIGVQAWGFSSQVLPLNIHWNIQYNGDHPGMFFHVVVMNVMFEFNVYDIRHEDHYDN